MLLPFLNPYLSGIMPGQWFFLTSYSIPFSACPTPGRSKEFCSKYNHTVEYAKTFNHFIKIIKTPMNP